MMCFSQVSDNIFKGILLEGMTFHLCAGSERPEALSA